MENLLDLLKLTGYYVGAYKDVKGTFTFLLIGPRDEVALAVTEEGYGIALDTFIRVVKNFLGLD